MTDGVNAGAATIHPAVLRRVGPHLEHPIGSGSRLRRRAGRAAVHGEHQRPVGPRIVRARQLHEHRDRRSGRHVDRQLDDLIPAVDARRRRRIRAAAAPHRLLDIVEALAGHRRSATRRRPAPLRRRESRHPTRARDTLWTRSPSRSLGGWLAPAAAACHESAEQHRRDDRVPHGCASYPAYVVSAFRRTVTVRLKPDTTYD